MVQAVPLAQWRQNYLVHAPTSWTANYVDLVALNGAQVTVDGTMVSNWLPVGSSGYSVAHIQLLDVGGGNHTISSGSPISASVYGVQSAGSYWYPGGLDLSPTGM